MRVLVNSLSDGFGGVESLFFNLLNCNQYNELEFDFTCPVAICAREEDFRKFGADIFFLPRPSRSLFKYIKAFRNVIKTNIADGYITL